MIYIDLGATYTRIKDKEIRVYETKKIDVVKLIDRLSIKNRVIIAFAGGVKKNKIIFSPNIDFANELNSLIEKRDIIIENDLNLAALADSRYFNVDNLVSFYIGTGAGAGIVYKREIYKGDGLAGEIGHTPYKKTPFICGCGKDNCLELTMSGKAIERKGKEYIKSGEFLEAFFKASSILTTIFAPKMLVLGGGVIEHNPLLVKLLKDNIKKYALNFSIPKIEETKLKDAPLIGAEILGREIV